MTANRRTLIIVPIAIAAMVCGAWFYFARAESHTHQTEKLSGETSFDVYAEGGRIHMLVLREHGDHQSVAYRQWAAGATVREVALPTLAKDTIISRRSNDLQIAAAGNHLLAAWQVAGTGYANRGPIRTAESMDGGRTWRQASPPTAANRTDDQGFIDIEADEHGRFHIVWLDRGEIPQETLPAEKKRGASKGLRSAVLADGKWAPPQTIDAETCQCCWNSLRKNPQGELMVLYRNARPRDMALAKFDGQAWNKTGIVDGFGWKVEMCPHAGGGIAFDRDNTYAVIWTGLEAAVGCHLSRKKNGAPLWHKPQKFGNTSARNPDIAVNATGIAIVWDEFEGENRRAKAMRLPNSEATALSAAQTISAGAAASYPRVVADGAAFHAFWTETKNGEAKIRGRKL